MSGYARVLVSDAISSGTDGVYSYVSYVDDLLFPQSLSQSVSDRGPRNVVDIRYL